MKKSTKGVLATGAAAALLLGGAGTLAFWTATDDVDGGVITAGDLKLTDGTCEDGFVYAPDSASAGDPVELFVPGDEIAKVCTFELQATGDNLSAAISVPDSFTPTFQTAGGASEVATSAVINVTATYEVAGGVGGAAPRTIADGELVTSDDDGATITATILYDVPFGTNDVSPNGNDMQDIEASFEDLVVSLTQVDPNL